jgi:uncharacterized protein DUF2510
MLNALDTSDQGTSPQMNQQGSPPPNWYPDPRGEAELRYWDGSQWTEHTHSAAAAPPAAPPPAQAPPPQAPPPQAPPPQAPPPQAAPPSAPPPQAAAPAGPSYGSAPPAPAGGGGNRTLLIVGAVVVGLLVVGGAVALLAGGGDSGGGEEGKVKGVVKKAITGKEPEGCRDLVTPAFIQKSTHETGSAGITACEKDRASSSTSDNVDISDVKVSGDTATAKAKLQGGQLKGETLELKLVKASGDWKIDDADRPSQADPDQAERTIITTVLNFGSSEGDKACEYLSFKKLQAMGGTTGCKSQFANATAANYLPQDTQVTGATATITVRETKRDSIIKFDLSRELGTWRIDEFKKQ